MKLYDLNNPNAAYSKKNPLDIGLASRAKAYFENRIHGLEELGYCISPAITDIDFENLPDKVTFKVSRIVDGTVTPIYEMVLEKED